MENVYILGLVSVFIIIIIVMVFIFKSLLTKSKNEKEILIEKLSKSEKNIDHQVQVKLEEITYSLRNQINDLKQEIIEERESSYKRGVDDSIKNFEKDFYVQIQPYKEDYEKEQGFLFWESKEKHIEAGYIYQLFIKGLPALQPHYQPIERFKSINQKIDEDKVIKLIEKATELYTGQVGNFIKVAKNVQQIS